MSRIPLPVIQDGKQLVECTSCGQCCTYVGISINAPSRPRYATDVLWYLYHENVYVYLDGDGEWSVHFEARCRNLSPTTACGVYLERPAHLPRLRQPQLRGERSRPTARSPSATRGCSWSGCAQHKPRVYAKIEQDPCPAGAAPGSARRASAR